MPIRLMLAYLGVDYEDKLYTLTKPPHNKEEWFVVKNSLGLDFPNVRLKLCHLFSISFETKVLLFNGISNNEGCIVYVWSASNFENLFYYHTITLA